MLLHPKLLRSFHRIKSVKAKMTLEKRNDQLLQSFRSHGMALYELQLNALHMRRYQKDYFLAINNPAERSR